MARHGFDVSHVEFPPKARRSLYSLLAGFSLARCHFIELDCLSNLLCKGSTCLIASGKQVETGAGSDASAAQGTLCLFQ